ncbi:MAG: hypothetical protein DRH90_12475 [Deltaproteobacteria bacterium]|nr:MAG: hypothetical protein DRH90_12475 [Deltaproteobacteria bacterium]
MAELEIVGFDSIGKELEAPQGTDTYVAKKVVNFEQAIITVSVNARSITEDGAKLDLISVTTPVDLDDLVTTIAGIGTPVVLKGSWDASLGTFPASTVAGESWVVETQGLVDGVDCNIGDRILALIDLASSTVYTGQWLLLDYTDQITTVAGRTGIITLTEADITDLQSYLIVDDIDTLAKLNAVITDATLGDSADFATAAQGVLASTALQPADLIPPITVVNLSAYNLAPADEFLHVIYTNTGAVTALTLMSVESAITGRSVVIKDAGGNASVNSITINCEAAQTIDGNLTYVLSTNYESAHLYSDGVNWFSY